MGGGLNNQNSLLSTPLHVTLLLLTFYESIIIIVVSCDYLCNGFNPAVIRQKYNVKYVIVTIDMGQLTIQ